MKFDIYRLWVSSPFGQESTKPTDITFKARNQREADEKAHKFMAKAEIVNKWYCARKDW